MLVNADQFGLSKDMSLHGFFELLACRLRWQVEWAIQSIEAENVSVRFAGRRCGTIVADFVKIVLPLTSTVGQGGSATQVAFEFTKLSRQVVQHPVHEFAIRSVGVYAKRAKARVPDGGSVHSRGGD